MYEFSEITLNCLKKAGWTPDYRFDPSDSFAFFADIKIAIPQKAREFISHFGGLKIMHPHINVDNYWEELVFDCQLSWIQSHGKLWSQSIEETVGASLFPIGTCDSDCVFLFMAESGRVYVDMGNYCYAADSGEKLIEQICTRFIWNDCHPSQIEGMEARLIAEEAGKHAI